MRLGAGTAMGGGQWTALTSYPVGSTGMDTAEGKGSASAGVVTGSGGGDRGRFQRHHVG